LADLDAEAGAADDLNLGNGGEGKADLACSSAWGQAKEKG